MRRGLSRALVIALPIAGGCVTNMEVGNTGGGGSATTGGNGGEAVTTTTGATGGGGTGGIPGTGGMPSTGGMGGSTATSGGGGGGGMPSTGGTGGATTTSTGAGMLDDADQDGWTVADGDCCDSELPECGNKPELVNPGALEYPGNGIDDDCDPSTLDAAPFPTCSTAAQAQSDIDAQASISALKVVKAMDLCQFTQEDPPPADKTWGVISATYTLADGSEANPPKNIQLGVLPSFGPNVLPQYGETMAALSTGTARRLNHPNTPDPGYVHPQNGSGAGEIGSYDAGTACSAPPDYLAANGGALPAPCGDCVGALCNQAYDSVALRIRIRPPSNAKGFTYRLYFFSAEYPEFLCNDYNDFFLALLDGVSAPDIPLDKNVAKDSAGNPISVNNGFFNVCFQAPGAPPGQCDGGTLGLIGNGMGGWNGSITDGGATGWLQNDVPLALKLNPNPPEPNEPTDFIPIVETFDLELMIWDAGDHNVDSLVLLDRFRWSLDKTELKTDHN